MEPIQGELSAVSSRLSDLIAESLYGEHMIPAGPRTVRRSPQRMLVLPLAFILGLACSALLAPVGQNPKLALPG